MRYFIHIAYNGNNYRGWQKLPGIVSVQQVIETKLSQILKRTIPVIGCGRTDAQVHASQFFFHFDAEQELSKLVGKKADLAAKTALRGRLRNEILAEARSVYAA